MLIEFYWDLGKQIAEKEISWGSKFLENLSKDLQKEFPDIKGFSVSNLKTCKLFYNYFSSQVVNQIESSRNELSSQAVNQPEEDKIPCNQLGVFRIPWGHIKLLITKIKNREEAEFYIQQTIENNWSRETLTNNIKSDLYYRAGNL